MHSDILNYIKLAFNSLKMIENDTVYQPIKRDDQPLTERGTLVQCTRQIKRGTSQRNLCRTVGLYSCVQLAAAMFDQCRIPIITGSPRYVIILRLFNNKR